MENATEEHESVKSIANSIKKIVLAIAAIVLIDVALGIFNRAHAGSVAGFGGATEITQLANNAELVSQNVQSQIQSAQLVEQTYLQQLQQLKSSIGVYTLPYQTTQATYQKVEQYQSQLLNLQSSVGDLSGALESRYREMAASNLDWQDWLAREKSLIQSGDGRARAEIQSNQAVLESTQSAIDAYQKTAAGMNDSAGVHQATQILGAQLTLMGGDINKLIALTAQTNTAKALDQQDKAAERQRALSDEAEVEAKQDAIESERQKELKQFLDAAKNQ